MDGLVDIWAGWSGASAAGLGRAGTGSHQCHPGVLPASPGMQYHKLTEHFDEKPFSCEECGAKFAANSTLKNHLRLHTGDRPFMCKHCLMTFMQASALAYHTKKKHAEGEPSLQSLAPGLACSIHSFLPYSSICLLVASPASPSFGRLLPDLFHPRGFICCSLLCLSPILFSSSSL